MRVLKLALAFMVIMLFNATACAKKYTFSEILDQSINNSFQLKAADYNVQLRAQISKEVRADYFPNIFVSYDNQFSRDLKGGNSQTQIVGDTLISANTLRKNVLRFRAQYNLFDFGIRGRKYAMSKADILKEQALHSKMRRDLSEQIIGIYTDVLASHKEKQTYSELAELYKDIFEMKERLFAAGESSKIDVMDEAVNIARAEDRIKLADIRMEQALDQLSGFTYEEYDTETFEPENFSEMFIDMANNTETRSLDLNYTPENQIYAIDFMNKQRELSIKRRESLPKVSVYSDYYMYGSHPKKFYDAVKDLSKSTFGLGFSASMPIFDGFRNKHERKRLKLELEKIECEQKHVLQELLAKYNAVKAEWLGYKSEYQIQKKAEGLLKEKFDMMSRLSDQDMVNQTEFLTTEVDYIKQKLESEISYIRYVAASIRLNMMEDNSMERL